jgi:repressor LexA
VLEFVEKFMFERGYSPSVREIAKKFRMRAIWGAAKHLQALEKKGYIYRNKDVARSIEVIGASPRYVTAVPVVGDVAAGEPILAVENIEGMVPIPRALARERDSFLLQIKGNSMIGAGIFDGDYVLVKSQSTAENGEIVVILIEDEATVKRFYRKKDVIELVPENPDMEPIQVRKGKDISIVGKVTAVIRVLDRATAIY